MSETSDLLADFAAHPDTDELIGQLEHLLEGHGNGVVLSALSQLLISSHLDLLVNDDGVVCAPCANADLTELLQALRKLHDGLLEAMPKESH